MFGQPSLRRRLVLSYVTVVLAVTAAAFVTVQVLVPQFFEQAVQERVGPGPQNNGNQTPGQGNTPQGQNTPTTETAPSSDPGSDDPPPPTTTTAGPSPTGSTIGPGGPDVDPEDPPGGEGEGEGRREGSDDQGGNGQGGSTTTTIEAAGFFVPGIWAAGPILAVVERSPVPVEIQEDYEKALTSALVVATLVGLIIALGLGLLLTRRLLRTFNQIKEGASLLADGHYKTRIAIPREIELADMAESVNTLADSLERTEQTRARLVSDLAHEIRNPLSTIEGYMEGLIDGVLPASRETYEAIADEAHRLKRLTWDLSTLSKAQEGAIEYVPEPIDLRDVVGRVVETLEPQYEINEVALKIDLPDTMPVQVDSDRMAQAVMNVLGNALAHTPPGGNVVVSAHQDALSVGVTIADSGPGIPQKELETVFERFTRLDHSQSGTGIGLNIARTLVRAHGGEITANPSQPDQGATFVITLPRRAT